MASAKEAMVICLDVGPSMAGTDDGSPDSLSRLDQALHCVSMILQRKIFTESKDEVALVLLGSRETKNELADEDEDGGQYQQIRVVRGLQLADWDLVRFVENDIAASDVSGDFVDALVVCLDLLVRESEGKKFKFRSILLLTDLASPFVDDSVDTVINSMKKLDVELTFIGSFPIDIDDDDDDAGTSGENGYPGDDRQRRMKKSESMLQQERGARGGRKPKTAWQKSAERMIRYIAGRTEANCFTLNHALQTVAYFERKSVKPWPWYADLQIGNDVAIPVAAYKKVEEYKPKKTWKNSYAADEEAELQNQRTYHLNDDEQSEINSEDVVKAYRYGTTLVPFDKIDQDSMKPTVDKGLTIIGFYMSNQVNRQMYCGDCSWIIVPDHRQDEPTAVALSSLVLAMKEEDKVAIVRYCFRVGSQPKLMVLIPVIKLRRGKPEEVTDWAEEVKVGNVQKAHLVMIQLPYFEDVRSFLFPSLETSVAADRRLKQNDKEGKVLDQLIDSLDLTNFDDDCESIIKQESGEDVIDGTEVMRSERMPNPYIQRLFYSLQQRVLYPDQPLPDIPAGLSRQLEAPEVLQDEAKASYKAVRNAFSLELNEKREKQKLLRTAAEDFKNRDGEPSAKQARLDDIVDIGASLGLAAAAAIDHVGTVTPVDDFQKLISNPDQSVVDSAFDQLVQIIRQFVFESYKTVSYGKAMECLKALRKCCIEKNRPMVFNNFMGNFKPELPKKNRRDFWELIVKEDISLIQKDESSASGNTVSPADCEDFLHGQASKPPPQVVPPSADNDEADVLDMLE